MRNKKIVKILAAVISVLAFSVFTYYYKPPAKFSIQDGLPIVLFTFFLFSAVYTTIQLVTPAKKALLISLTITSTLFIKQYRIIPIITYAICLPLLFLPAKPAEEETLEV